MFLSHQEIEDLTGYKFGKYQAGWLRKNGIKYLIGYDRKPRVMRSHLENIMDGITSKKIDRRRSEPNFAAIM